MRGKSINLYLMDGDAAGRIKCTLANWTGVAYKIPRTELDKCKERDDLKQSGVYFLFGTSDDTGKGVVYIGQAGARKNGEGILNRLLEHKRNPEKDYWTEAVVFTTSNNSFGPTEISYLENRFCNLAILANRYDVKMAMIRRQETSQRKKNVRWKNSLTMLKSLWAPLVISCLSQLIKKRQRTTQQIRMMP